MTVFRAKRRRTYTYDFVFEGKRYTDNTKQTRQSDAELVESQIKLKLRQAAGGVAIVGVEDTPRFQKWSEVYADHVRRRTKITRPERIDDLIRVALRFWGARPGPSSKIATVDGEPYHDLRLGDVVRDPSWILRFEDWLDTPHVDAKGRMHAWSGQTKNQYRSLLNQLFKLAIRPEWRQKTNILQNPFMGMHRDAAQGREVSLERDELLLIIACASYHLRLACSIAMLSPKLREGNILALRFDEHFSPDMRTITVHQHKTRRSTGKPLVAYIPDQLRTTLQRARLKSKSGFVVEYGGGRIHELRGAVRGAVERAATVMPALRYGRAHADGITFHTLRHTAATLMVDLDVPPETRQKVLAHKRLDTTMGYTHLPPRHEIAAQEKLSTHLPIETLVHNDWRGRDGRRAPRPGDVKIDGTQEQDTVETLSNSPNPVEIDKPA